MNSCDPASSRLNFDSEAISQLPIDLLSESGGVELLYRIVQKDVVSDGASSNPLLRRQVDCAKELMRQLGGFPLAIMQIANYMLEAQCDILEILDIYSDYYDRDSLLDEDAGMQHMGYPHSLRTVWEISTSRIERANVNSVHLLQLLALLDPDGFPEAILTGSDRVFEGTIAPRLHYLNNRMQYP